jgi:uncharacterized membrane protein
MNIDILKLIKINKRNLIILFSVLFLTWIIGISNFFFSYASYSFNAKYNIDKETAISLYPQNVLSIHNYEQTGSKFFTNHIDPMIYVLPPEQKITSTLIEFEKPISVKANVQIYYAENGEPLSEKNCVLGFFYGSNRKEIVINLPPAIYTTLRYDINIIDKEFEIKKIYVSEIPIEIQYTSSWTGNYDGILMTMVINFFIILLWVLGIRTGYIDKFVLSIFNITLTIKKYPRKIIKNVSIIIAIIIIAIIIESIFYYFSRNNSFFNIYRVFLYATLGLVSYFIIILRSKPEKLFIFISLLIGMLYILSFPPHIRISWDEETHYRKSVEQSFISKVSINKSINEFCQTSPVSYLTVNMFDKRIKDDYLVNVNSYENNVTIEYYSKENNYIDFYKDIIYTPAGLMIFIGRSLVLQESQIFILGRIGIHLMYTLLIYLALKRLNSGKYIMLVIALLPTAFYQSVTYSYDYWVTAFLMLGIAYFFHEIQNPQEKITKKNLIVMLGSFVLGLGPKAIYFPLMLILYFIPKEKFYKKENYKNYLITVTFFIFFIIMSFMLPLIATRGAAFTDIRGGSDVSAKGQIKFILQNPKTYTIILLKFLKSYLNIFKGQSYTISLAYLGNIPYHNLILILLGFIVVTDKNEKDILSSSVKYKIFFFILVFTTIVLFTTSMYISFTTVGESGIRGVQGRYLLPVLFPLFYILGSSKIQNYMNKQLYSCIVFGIMSFILLNGIWEACISKYN